jgi:cell division protein FtsZ
MHSQNIDGVNFIICNTDAQALQSSNIPNKVQLGPHLTQGLGAGANPEIGRQATEESFEEIKKILEVNTKMAFITAGMGGGTGTGGAPIISKICKDLGILTVGIVTTPFAYEGKKRQLQAEEGIKTMKQYVDTLLVISNDKLRNQFGNLKMREAFEKADNVLATAAKCITDVINSTGQINVDFADVCTVMRNGGVAILGNAAAEGNRAQKAIEEALNSPLLNDNDIRGAKWILININSAQGEHEHTMDEVEVIQQYLLEQAGDNTDVILGLGYDNTLGSKLGITLIATGFEHKDPFAKAVPKKEEPKPEEKIVMVLDTTKEEPITTCLLKQPEVVSVAKEETEESKTLLAEVSNKEMEVMEAALQTEQQEDYLAPKLVEVSTVNQIPVMLAPVIDITDIREEANEVIHYELKPDLENILSSSTEEIAGNSTVDKIESIEETVSINSVEEQPLPAIKETDAELILSFKDNSQTVSAASGGYLARPSNIYAASNAEEKTSVVAVEKPVPVQSSASNEQEELLELQMQIVERDDIPAADMPLAYQAQSPLQQEVEDASLTNETEEQQRKAAERLHKLRNLSFNVNGADPNNEFETVPAFIRRKMELHSNTTPVENFYSNIEVKAGDSKQANLSTLNTFLDGKKPD